MDEPSRDLWLSHLERVMALSEANEGQLDAEDRRAIALELGIDEAQLEAARSSAQDCFVRGRGYAARSMWTDAIAELEEALALDPERMEIVTALAQAHLRRATDEDEEEHAAHAERFARYALQQDPDDAEAFGVLEALRAHASRRAARRRHTMLGVVGVVVLGAGIAVAALARAPAPPGSAEAPASAPPMSATPPRAAEAQRPPSPAAKADGCPRGTAFEPGKGCVAQSVVLVPGEGVAGLRVGVSSPQDVLDVFGDDARVSRHADGSIYQLSYLYRADGTYSPSRRVNRSRPSELRFEDGRLTAIVVGAHAKALRTSGGLDTVRSTREDMLEQLGNRYELDHGDVLDIYLYQSQGIEVWVNRESGRVNSFRIIPREG